MKILSTIHRKVFRHLFPKKKKPSPGIGKLTKVRGDLAKAQEKLGRLLEEKQSLSARLRDASVQKTGSLDHYKLQISLAEKVETARVKAASGMQLTLEERELLAGVRPVTLSRVFPRRVAPPADVAFVTVANDKFLPGLEALIASLLTVYPDMQAPVVVFHDGTLNDFVQRRLKNLYPRVSFEVPDMSWFTDVPSSSGNHKRIGVLGFMNVMALGMTGYRRVILVDSDILILDDISALWTGRDTALGDETEHPVDEEAVFVCYDCGMRPYVAKSPVTGDYIYNSGVISVPASLITPESLAEIKALTIRTAEPYCDLIDRFADQKVWNRFLVGKRKATLPVNFNCNIKYMQKFLDGRSDFLRIVHFTGEKPWFTQEYLNERFLEASPAEVPAGAEAWRASYRANVGRLRQAAFIRTRTAGGPIRSSKRDRTFEGRRTCFFIGNGPSLARTDLSEIRGFETFAFNWFVLHEKFDWVQPDHLLLASHMLFGGWNTQTPALPESYLAALRQKQWRPTLWASFYFREYFEMTGLSEEFDVRYVLFEKPHKVFIDRQGSMTMDTRGFMQDGRTGVLSMALPLAKEFGFEQVGLVGCDSSYNQGTTQNYFYATELHQSESTRETSLTNTWAPEGPGRHAYTVAARVAAENNVRILDFTVDASLPLERRSVAALAGSPEPVRLANAG